MRILKILICFVLFSFVVYGEEAKSKAMEKIKLFMPTVTESAGLANAVNVYLKVSDWVRATAAVVKSMKSAIQDIRDARAAIDDIIHTAQAMKNFRFNNMDTWASTVANARVIVGPQTSAVLRAFECFEAHTIGDTLGGGVLGFIGDIKNIKEFDIKDPKNAKRRLISQTFSPDDNASYLNSVIDTMKNSTDKKNRFLAIRAELVKDSQVVAQTLRGNLSPLNRKTYSDSLLHIERRIRRIDKKITIQENIKEGLDFTTKADTIIADCKELMAANMSRIDEIFKSVLKFEDGAADMMEAVSRLQGNKISGVPKSQISISIDGYKHDSSSMVVGEEKEKDWSSITTKDGVSIYNDTDPDRAPIPKNNVALNADIFGDMDKKDVNTQDIVQLRCQINLYLLKQEKILRDIEAMKANTLAYLMIVDGNNRSASLAAYDALKLYATYYSDSTLTGLPTNERLKLHH